MSGSMRRFMARSCFLAALGVAWVTGQFLIPSVEADGANHCCEEAYAYNPDVPGEGNASCQCEEDLVGKKSCQNEGTEACTGKKWQKIKNGKCIAGKEGKTCEDNSVTDTVTVYEGHYECKQPVDECDDDDDCDCVYRVPENANSNNSTAPSCGPDVCE